MFNEKLPAWLRSSACAFAYWVVFLLALEPGNILRAHSLGHSLAVDREVLRIGVAALLACTTAPLIVALNRRHSIFQPDHLRSIAVHGAVTAALSFVLILISCVLAAWMLLGKSLPSHEEIRGQLAANWLLLTFALNAFGVLSHALGLAPAPASRPTLPHVATVPVRTRGRPGRVELASVEWIESQGNYLALHVGGASHLVRETLGAFAARIDQSRFVRVHRRVIVAIDRIREIEPLANGDSLLILQNGHRIRASRSYRDSVRARWAESVSRRPATP